MIEAPTNVYPNNDTVWFDKSHTGDDYTNCPTRKFTFNGDSLSYVCTEWFNNDTGRSVLLSVFPTEEPYTNVKNGDEVSVLMNSARDCLDNNNDYYYNMTLFQNDENGNPLCNMLKGSGIVSVGGTNVSTITVDKYSPVIKTPTVIMDGTKVVGRCVLKIISADSDGNYSNINKINVTDYNWSTGVLTLASSINGTVKEGDRYEIWGNYYKTPNYFFKARVPATLTPEAHKDTEYNSVKVSCEYGITSTDNVSLQNYSWSCTSSSSPLYSPTIYSYHKKYANYDTSARLNYEFPVLPTKTLTLKVNTYSQDNYYVTKSIQLSPMVTLSNYTSDNELYSLYNGISNNITYTNGIGINYEHNCVEIKFTKKETEKKIKRVILYRYKKKGADTDFTALYHYTTNSYVNTTNSVDLKFRDYLVEEGATYGYCLTQTYEDDTTSTTSEAYFIGNVTFNQCLNYEYIIQGLTNSSNNIFTIFDKQHYNASNSWGFVTVSGNPTITYNNNYFVHENGFKEPQISKSENDYASGTLSGGLIDKIYINDSDNISMYTKCTPQLVQSWHDFLNNYDLFILRTKNFPAMIVKLSANTEISIDDNNLGMTNFEFVQYCDFEDIIIG